MNFWVAAAFFKQTVVFCALMWALWLGLCLTAQKQHWCDGGKADMIASLCNKRILII